MFAWLYDKYNTVHGYDISRKLNETFQVNQNISLYIESTILNPVIELTFISN